MDWQQVAAEFEWDGSLRDLYVLDTDAAVWQEALDFLRAAGYPLTYSEDSVETELPTEVAVILRRRLEKHTMLSVDVQGIHIACHFFYAGEIEFDIDPREVSDEARFGHLCEFIRGVGKRLGRSVILTPEMCGGREDEAIIRYLPADDRFVYTPVGVPGRVPVRAAEGTIGL